MTEIQNPKQKNNRFEPVWNLYFGICDLFVLWCLEFVISAIHEPSKISYGGGGRNFSRLIKKILT